MPIDFREPITASQFDADELERNRGQRCARENNGWHCARDDCDALLGKDDAIFCPVHERERAESVRMRVAEHVKAVLKDSAEGLNAQLPPWDHAVADTPVFRNAVDPRLHKAVHTWDGRTNLAIFGPTGSGKTTFIIAMLRAYFKRRLLEWKAEAISVQEPHPFLRAHWTTAHQLVQAERRSPLGSEPEAITKAKQARVLVVDEVGFEPRSTVLFEIVNDRYEKRTGTTILTSGLTPEEFADPSKYGSALYRRLVEKGIGREINLFAETDA